MKNYNITINFFTEDDKDDNFVINQLLPHINADLMNQKINYELKRYTIDFNVHVGIFRCGSLYYNKDKDFYWLVFNISDDMIFGRRSFPGNPSYLDSYMNSERNNNLVEAKKGIFIDMNNIFNERYTIKEKTNPFLEIFDGSKYDFVVEVDKKLFKKLYRMV